MGGTPHVRHVTDAEIRLLVSGRLEDQLEERRRIVRHLLSACPDCLPKITPYASLLDDDEEVAISAMPVFDDEAAYDGILERSLAAAVRREAEARHERAWRDRFLADVRSRGLIGFDAIVDAISDEMPARARLESLLALSFEARYRNPREMLLLARGAQVVAISLGKEPDRDLYSPAEVADLRAQAWAELANAYRVCEDIEAAASALAQAFAAREDGSDDRCLLARLLDVQASLLTDQRRLDEAVHLLDTVHDIYLQVGESHLAGRALVSKGISIHYDGRPAEAVGVLRKGLGLLDSQRDPQLLATGHQALLDAMAANGEYSAAKRLLFESGLRHVFAADPLNLLKLDWLEGRILAGLHKLPQAERVLAVVQGGFHDAGLDYEASLVALERAGVLLQQGQAAEVEALAEEALETFLLLDIGHEAVHAVRYLQEAVRQRVATAGLVRQVLDFLQRLERRPYLRFTP